ENVSGKGRRRDERRSVCLRARGREGFEPSRMLGAAAGPSARTMRIRDVPAIGRANVWKDIRAAGALRPNFVGRLGEASSRPWMQWDGRCCRARQRVRQVVGSEAGGRGSAEAPRNGAPRRALPRRRGTARLGAPWSRLPAANAREDADGRGRQVARRATPRTLRDAVGAGAEVLPRHRGVERASATSSQVARERASGDRAATGCVPRPAKG
ncbi:MAG: hypothetical protein FD161_4968, partial [Limisphaerales bacterium]